MNIPQLKQLLQNNITYGENGRPQAKHGVLSLVSLVMPDTSKVWGVDISHWNLPGVDLKRMVDLYGLKFVIIKGCDGALNSKYYLDHVASAKAAGIPWGIYNWLYPASKVNMDAQVNAWYARYNADVPPMGIFIDAETTYYGGVLANPSATDLRSAHNKWMTKAGKEATTYTGKYFADTYLIGFDFSREPLWIANYGVNSPALPKGATTYHLWQFTSTLDGKQLDPNGNYELDGNYYNGTLAQFQAEYGYIVTPPPTEEKMRYFTIAGTPTIPATVKMNIRSTVGITTTNDVGDLFAGDKIEVSETVNVSATDKWGKLSKIIRANGAEFPLPAPVCYVSLNTANTVETFPQLKTITDVNIKLAAGSVVTTVYSDGTSESRTA
jgi:GH25 family lysozyme M1 (1,4-beta-N-acetylmuramidase)